MQPQRSFADVEYDGKKRQTRRERFLQRMDGLIPWQRLEQRLRPVYTHRGTRASPVSVAGDAADSLCAAVLQPQRPGDGGRAL